MTKVLEKATPALARPLDPKSEAEIGKLKIRLSDAGFRGEHAGSVFLGLKFVGLLGRVVARRRRDPAASPDWAKNR